MVESERIKAWAHTAAGQASNVLTLKDFPEPIKKKESEVVVRVSHVALHPGASIILQLCPSIFRNTFSIPETDFSGTIVGQPGKVVFGSIPVGEHIRGSGALAEYLVIDPCNIVEKPDNISSAQAAGLSVSGCTALALMRKASLKQGDSVLVNGSSGGIGHMVIQLAKEAVGESGKVVAICSKKNISMVEALGADEVVDYETKNPVHQYLAKEYSNPRFDCIIDAFGIQELYLHCHNFLAAAKPYVTVGPAFKEYTYSSVLYTVLLALKNILLPGLFGGGKRPYLQVAATVSREDLEKLAELAREGKLRVLVENPVPMENALMAYERLHSRRARGKVVVEVRGNRF